ncbi:MAG: hypothetical protein IIY08_04425 [Cellulosilyticum sp.]|nr:hypothetical protein [Cellulosilyticum sp.]
MRKRHKKVRNGVVALTICIAGGLGVCGQRVHALTKDIDYQISVEQLAVDEKKEKLAQMEQQLQDMDSLEYIKEAASELGMVEKDTIVIKERE